MLGFSFFLLLVLFIWLDNSRLIKSNEKLREAIKEMNDSIQELRESQTGESGEEWKYGKYEEDEE